MNLGLADLKRGQPAKAVAPLEKAATDPALAGEARYLLGAAFFELGEFSKVPAQLGGLEGSPHAEHVLFMLEESCRLTHRVAEAQRAFHELIGRFPDSAWAHYLMGNAYESQADNEKAVAEYRAALARNPTLPNANFAIGYLYWKDHAFEDAKPWLNQELSLQPCHTLACYYLAEMARVDGDANTAARFYRRAIQCDDRNAKAHLGLGIVLAALNRDDQAAREFERAIHLDPGDATAHYRLAVLYRKLGRTTEASAEYARVQQIHASEQAAAVDRLKVRP